MNKQENTPIEENKNSSTKLKEIKWKIERFFGKNIIFFGIVLSIVLFKLIGAVQDLTDSQTNVNKELHDYKLSYVAVTDSGVLVNLPRTFIKPLEKQNEVAEILKVLLVDRATISKGFSVSSFQTPEEILNNSMDLQRFVYNYILVQRGADDKIKELQKSGYGYLQAYLAFVKDMFAGVKAEDGSVQEMPHYLKVIDKTVNKYEFKDNNFVIDVTYNVILNTYAGKDPQTNKPIWRQKNGTSRIVANGYFDIQTQNIGINYEDSLTKTSLTGTNYNGIHFNYFKVFYGI